MNTPSDNQSQKLVAAAAAWRLAALLLERPRLGWHQEIQRLSAEVSDRQLYACARQADDACEETYHQLFGPGASGSPREVSYCGFEDPGRLMAELNAFYRAFGFAPHREESIDHLAVETGFVAYLFLKEAYAKMCGEVESAAITLGARDQFIGEHLGRCTRGLEERLSDAPPYLRGTLTWIVRKVSERHRSG